MFDILIRNANIVDVTAKRIFSGDIGIQNGIIADIGHITETEAGKEIDVSGKYLLPGFIDFHLHIESSLLSPLQFCRAACLHGTTAVFVDPHEIANVCGRRGIELFIDQARLVPLDMYIGIPSCVPATHLETSGSIITLEDIGDLIPENRIYGLAEMMNFPGVIHGLGDAREKVDLAFEYGKMVDGHCPGLRGNQLKTYVSNGKNDGIVRIMSDHETGGFKEAVEKAELGMAVGLRYGSASHDMDNILPDLIRENINLDRFMLCSDDLDPLDLYRDGHMDRIIKRARDIFMENGSFDLESATIHAVSLATLNTANHYAPYFKLQNLPETGKVEVGSKANLVVLDSLENFNADIVIHNGKIRVENSRYLGRDPDYDYQPFYNKVNLGRILNPEDLIVTAPPAVESVEVNIIDVIPGSIVTGFKTSEIEVKNNEIMADRPNDIAKIAVFERHHGSGRHAIGFVRGLGIRHGAIASTIAHDSHNLIVAGMDDLSMARAVNHLVEKGGGMVAVSETIDYFPLSICGLMSDAPLEAVVEGYSRIRNRAIQMGSPLNNTFMTMAFLALPVIPKLKITDLGLVDVEKFEFISLF
jgi:adenine deaminase